MTGHDGIEYEAPWDLIAAIGEEEFAKRAAALEALLESGRKYMSSSEIAAALGISVATLHHWHEAHGFGGDSLIKPEAN